MCTSAQLSSACTPQAVGQLRAWVMHQLGAWFTEPLDLGDDVGLIVAELASNAVRAGSPDLLATLTVHAHDVRVDLLDHAEGEPVLTPVDHTAHSGRGLHIVEALTVSWGVTPVSPPPGKTVWAVVPVPEGLVPSFDCRPAS